MPVSIQQALRGLGEERDNFLPVANNVFEQFGKEFLLNMGKFANKRKVVASGKLLTDSTFRINGNVMQILVPDYFDYPNEGVQGVRSSVNAPGSPYKFKNYGMNAEGRKKIKQYIADGHAKIDVVRKRGDKALGIGLEKKRLSVADLKANTLIYWIKRQGIKKTNYFTDAINETFGKDFELKMSEAVGADIVFTLEKLNRK